MVSGFSDMIEDMIKSVVGYLTEEQTNLKRQMSIVEKDIKTVKMRLATGEIPADVYSEAIVELNNRRDVLQLNLERVKMSLSNQ